MLFIYDLLGQLKDPCSVSLGYWTAASSAQSLHGSSSTSDASLKHCDSSLNKKKKKETQELFSLQFTSKYYWLMYIN